MKTQLALTGLLSAHHASQLQAKIRTQVTWQLTVALSSRYQTPRTELKRNHEDSSPLQHHPPTPPSCKTPSQLSPELFMGHCLNLVISLGHQEEYMAECQEPGPRCCLLYQMTSGRSLPSMKQFPQVSDWQNLTSGSLNKDPGANSYSSQTSKTPEP